MEHIEHTMDANASASSLGMPREAIESVRIATAMSILARAAVRAVSSTIKVDSCRRSWWGVMTAGSAASV